MKRLKLIIFTLIFILTPISLFAAVEADVVVGNIDPFDSTRTVTKLPAIFSYVPDSNVVFTESAEVSSYLPKNRAAAKLGTLTLVGWNTDEDTTYRPRPSSSSAYLNYFYPEQPEKNYVRHLYMGTGTAGQEVAPNFNVVTLTDENGNEIIARLYSIYHENGAVVLTQDLSYKALGNNTNPSPIRNSSRQNATMRIGDYVDFYLVTEKNYDALSNALGKPDPNEGIKLSVAQYNFRNIFQWVYRLNNSNSQTDRYYTGNITDADPIDNLIRNHVDGISFEGAKLPDPIFTVSIFPTLFATNLLHFPQRQKVGDVALNIINAEALNAVDKKVDLYYTIQSSTTKDFALRLKVNNTYVDAAGKIDYDLYLTQHSTTDPIEAGKEYKWEVNTDDQYHTSELFIELDTTDIDKKRAGVWGDVITITVKSDSLGIVEP